MTAKNKSINVQCSGVIRKEREIFDAMEFGAKIPKSCLVTEWSRSKIMSMRNYFALADEISEMGIPIDTVYDCMPKKLCNGRGYGGSNIIPTSLNRTSPIRKKMIDYIYDCCANNEYVNLKKLVTMCGVSKITITEEEIRANYKPEYVNATIANKRLAQSRRLHAVIPIEPVSKPLKQSGRDIVCDTAIRSVLTRIVAAGKAEDEYAALLYCIKLGAESLTPQ